VTDELFLFTQLTAFYTCYSTSYGTKQHRYGAIDELRIWNAALSESQVNEVMTGITSLETSLVGYWAFDEGTVSIVHDRSIHANDGMLIGNPTWVHSGAPGQ
jgi:hypothetical protein